MTRRCLLSPGLFALALGLLATAVVLAVAIGSVTLPPATVVSVLAAKVFPWLDWPRFTPTDEAIVWALRLPRVLVAALVGAALAVAGVQMQGLFRNPLASPDIIGTSAGARWGPLWPFQPDSQPFRRSTFQPSLSSEAPWRWWPSMV